MPQLSHAPSTGWVVALLESYARPSAGDAQLGLQDQGLKNLFPDFPNLEIQIFSEKNLNPQKEFILFSEKI